MPAKAQGLRIGISGSYGGVNLGDEAILHSIVDQLRSSLPVREIVVFSRDPRDTLARHAVDRALAMREMTREESRAEVQQLDLLILGGGGILYDKGVEVYLREVALAHEARIPVVIYAIGAGPLKQPESRQLVREHLTPAALVTVRDRQTLRLLQDAGVEREMQLTADPALLLQPKDLNSELLAREGLDTNRPLIAFSVREPGPAAPDIQAEHYQALLADTADFMIDRYDADVAFIAMEPRHKDLQQSHAVAARMYHARRAHILRGDYTSHDVLALLARCTFAVGMRLHLLIFAALQSVPFVALPYASKVTGLIEDLELQMPPLQQVTTGRLIAHLDYCWDHRDELREQIRAQLPALQERARSTQRLLVETLAQQSGSRRRA
ncbi:MAG TPA: polysaccharide pyruvyl transferase family protein [Steroidobacteraceae bacterium]|nr:polysaccharide pyruvyl transferase family protein [Steroidobacteraceae bacterium]